MGPRRPCRPCRGSGDPVAVFTAEVVDFAAGGLEDPQPEQPEHGDQGEVVTVGRGPCGGEEDLELQVGQSQGWDSGGTVGRRTCSAGECSRRPSMTQVRWNPATTDIRRDTVEGWNRRTSCSQRRDSSRCGRVAVNGWAAPRTTAQVTELQTRGLYAMVRHPLLTGMVLAFWATPQMGASHLLFALASTAYIVVGMRFEERDLRRSFGTSYDAYAAHVPALLPRLPMRAGPVSIPGPLTAETHRQR